jgi:SAM-dependent methyltransferase
MGVREHLPWWTRMIAKMLLSRIPIPYAWWRAMKIFKHGDMHDPSHAYNVFTTHLHRSFRTQVLCQEFTCLEIGSGDSLLAGLVARTYGASKIYMIDSGDYIVRDIGPYRRMVALLRSYGKPLREAENVTRLDDLLSACRIVHMTEGIRSLQTIPSGTVDFMWSQVVLEHVSKGEFVGLLQELRRVMRTDSVGSHSIDLRDHLGGALNNLRFSERLWESKFFRHSGFYTNRFRFTEILSMFNQAGFDVEVLNVQRWGALPTPRTAMVKPYASLDEVELRVAEFNVLVRPRNTI